MVYGAMLPQQKQSVSVDLKNCTRTFRYENCCFLWVPPKVQSVHCYTIYTNFTEQHAEPISQFSILRLLPTLFKGEGQGKCVVWSIHFCQRFEKRSAMSAGEWMSPFRISCPADKYMLAPFQGGAWRRYTRWFQGSLSSSVNYLTAPRQICKQIADDGPKGFLCMYWLLTYNILQTHWHLRSILIINTLQFVKAAASRTCILSSANWNQQINLQPVAMFFKLNKGFAHL
jgi:hypothetical protein